MKRAGKAAALTVLSGLLAVSIFRDTPANNTSVDTGVICVDTENVYMGDDVAKGDIFGGTLAETENDDGIFAFRLDDIPVYNDSPFFVLNDNVPLFTAKTDEADEIVVDEIVAEMIAVEGFEEYSDLDELGRCGPAFANVCPATMPSEERGEIGMIKPSGWHTVKYSDIIEDNYLYNRCHLIAYQLAGENANEKNLITGTRYMNIKGMQPFENVVADYVKRTGNHVLYRVTPVFEGDNLLASGVIMEALSVEDNGEGISFNVYVYNVQPGIVIDYATGESLRDEGWTVDDNAGDGSMSGEQTEDSDDLQKEISEYTYIVNINTHVFHYPSCQSIYDMKEKNRRGTDKTRDELIGKGYSPCKRCEP